MKSLILVLGLIGILIFGGCAGGGERRLSSEATRNYAIAKSTSQLPTATSEQIAQAYAVTIKVWTRRAAQEEYTNVIDQFVTRMDSVYFSRKNNLLLGMGATAQQQEEMVQRKNRGLDPDQASMPYFTTPQEEEAFKKIMDDMVLWYDPSALNTKSLALLGAMLMPRLKKVDEWPVLVRIYMTLANRPDSLASLQELPSFEIYGWDKIAPILQAFLNHREYHSQKVIEQSETLMKVIELAPFAVAKGQTNVKKYYRPDLDKLPMDVQEVTRPIFEIYHTASCRSIVMCQNWVGNLDRIGQTGKYEPGRPHLVGN